VQRALEATMQDPALIFDRVGKFVLLPIGLLLLLGAAYSVWSTRTWLETAIEAQGSVIEMVRVRDSDSKGYLYTPLVRFRTWDGNTIEFQSSLRTNPPAYRTGETVTVLYDPNEPQSASIRGFLSLWFVPMILTFIGSVFLLIGTAFVVVSAKVAQHLGEPATPAKPA
jgi:hypothetical protein